MAQRASPLLSLVVRSQEASLSMTLLRSIRDRFRRWRYCEGQTLSRFIAKDIRRDILIVSAARVEEGVISGRVRTTNVLYLIRGLAPAPEFEPATELRLDEMWHWSGQSWGGIADGTSLTVRLVAEGPDAEPGAEKDHGAG
jgi:hypothetical protein